MNERRKADRWAYRQIGPAADCPTPEKKTYRTKQQAKLALKKMPHKHDIAMGDFRAYKCPCGAYHLAHKR